MGIAMTADQLMGARLERRSRIIKPAQTVYS